ADGAFDDAADFDAHDVLAHTDRLRGVALRVGCGRSDPFIAANHALVDAVPDAEATFPHGAHDLGCWSLLRPGDMRFLGRNLAAH
ncbi:MAG TPA: hypothetical protein VGK35_06020, partial [Actinotalea sp.]